MTPNQGLEESAQQRARSWVPSLHLSLLEQEFQSRPCSITLKPVIPWKSSWTTSRPAVATLLLLYSKRRGPRCCQMRILLDELKVSYARDPNTNAVAK